MSISGHGGRSGAELVRATAPFTVEARGRTWRLLLEVSALWIVAEWGALRAPNLPLRLLAAVVASAAVVRLFIFYHDHLHGAVLRDSRVGRVVMELFGWYVLAVPSVWRETHNYHHQHNAKLAGSSIGSYPVVTLGMWRNMTPGQRLRYRLARHPLNMVLGYVTVFGLRYCIAPFLGNPRRHWTAPLSLVVHLAALAALVRTVGWGHALVAFSLPIAIAHAVGSYLFFAQHNAPEVRIVDRREWDYHFAALRSSTMFEMSPLMHWVTGNIGYHHVHHLNHRIPFCRLPEAMAALPELQSPPRTSWRCADVRRCVTGLVWDPARARMITLDEAGESVNEGMDWKRS